VKNIINNATFLSAERVTHLKIVVVALIASIAVGMVGISVHVRLVSSEALLQQQAGAS
jgi:ABC-type proline/glycine betaine transport system permease subunit